MNKLHLNLMHCHSDRFYLWMISSFRIQKKTKKKPILFKCQNLSLTSNWKKNFKYLQVWCKQILRLVFFRKSRRVHASQRHRLRLKKMCFLWKWVHSIVKVSFNKQQLQLLHQLILVLNMAARSCQVYQSQLLHTTKVGKKYIRHLIKRTRILIIKIEIAKKDQIQKAKSSWLRNVHGLWQFLCRWVCGQRADNEILWVKQQHWRETMD